jgi:hypothetical protein
MVPRGEQICKKDDGLCVAGDNAAVEVGDFDVAEVH